MRGYMDKKSTVTFGLLDELEILCLTATSCDISSDNDSVSLSAVKHMCVFKAVAGSGGVVILNSP